MIKLTLTELIFWGNKEEVRVNELKSLFNDSRDIRFNFPETEKEFSTDLFLHTLKTESYIDLVLVKRKIVIENSSLQNVFINIGLNGFEFEVLFFFDLSDWKDRNYKRAIESLREWAIEYLRLCNFSSFRCRIDNGGEREYYFDHRGYGPLYYLL